MSNDNPILLRRSKDQTPLVLVSDSKGNVLTLCLICGHGGEYEHVVKQSAGLISGLFSEKEIMNLRRQTLIALNQSN